MVYDRLDEYLLVPVSRCLQPTDSTWVQPYGLTMDVLMEIRGSLTLVNFLVVDMDPHQQTSIILGASFLEFIKAKINEKKGIISIRVEENTKSSPFPPNNQHIYIRFDSIIKWDQTRLNMWRCYQMSQNARTRMIVHRARDERIPEHPKRSPTQPNIPQVNPRGASRIPR
jgi:hypothetical protein